MKITRVTYLALAAVLSAASCSKEAAEPDVYEWKDGTIYFRTTISDISSTRAQDMTLERLESFQVTCFNTADRKKDPSGYLSPYFEDATFIRKGNAVAASYLPLTEGEAYNWPSNGGFMRFLAFSPSIEVMIDGNSALIGTDRSGYFNLINSTSETQSSVALSYRLDNVRINPDISEQFDFVTADASGERIKDFMGGVDLAFRHNLCQVEIRAWGASTRYDFELAGVRIGNPVVEGDFIFADDTAPATASGWKIAENAVKDKVEYLYRDSGSSGSGNESGIGDKLFRINNIEHKSQESAGSIMGSGGNAMVLPTVNNKWEGLADPDIDKIPYSTDRMYFSVLMRITDKSESNRVVYPYPGNPDGMTVVHYAVDNSGMIVARLYPGNTVNDYITEQGERYELKPGETIMDFGWAAVPVEVNWEAGKRYIYTINYTDGAGWRDPEDPKPGGKILKDNVLINFEIADWTEGTNSDITVPRK